MKKKKSGGGGANWMDTYGDMVTLLLCFFVLLYSMSSISEDNWKALVMSFNPLADLSTRDVIEGGNGPSADGDDTGVAPTPEDDISQDQIDAEIEDLFMALQAWAQSASMSETVTVSRDGSGRVFVTFRDTAFFDGDSPTLRAEAYPILDALDETLVKAGNAIDQVRILGHTAQGDPHKPNNPATDRSLSSNRASNVLIYIQTHTDAEELDPGKLISEGWGQWHPVADNATPEGRAANRRVEIIISGRNLEEELGSNIETYDTTNTYTTTGQTSTG